MLLANVIAAKTQGENGLFRRQLRGSTAEYVSKSDMCAISHEQIGDLYTHFTSPLRRYVDIVIHRNIKDLKYDNNICLTYINTTQRQIKDCSYSLTLVRQINQLAIIHGVEPISEKAVIRKIIDGSIYLSVKTKNVNIQNIRTRLFHPDNQDLVAIFDKNETVVINKKDKSKFIKLKEKDEIDILLIITMHLEVKLHIQIVKPDIRGLITGSKSSFECELF